MENRIGNIIKYYRKHRGLAQIELAELVGYKDKICQRKEFPAAIRP